MLMEQERGPERMRVDCLVEIIEAAREYLEHAVAQVPRTKFEQPGEAGPWSLKDVLAHIAWHDNQMIDLCETKDLVGSPWWELPMDERNDKIHEQFKETPLEEVLAFFDKAYLSMLTALKTLSDEDMNDAKRFTDMPEDWIPWRMIGNNSYEHYLRHVGQIRHLAKKIQET